MRECGDCQLCCKLLPVPPLGKLAGQKCVHQKVRKGCGVYNRSGMPPECKLWSCRWLVDPETQEMSRPDRSHYVVDLMPDFVTIVDNESGAQRNVEVIQIWMDPHHPEAHGDPALRRYLEERGAEGKIALIRLNSREAFTLIPPSMASDNQWHVFHANSKPGPTHSIYDIAEALGGAR